jgi:hypothetical protein
LGTDALDRYRHVLGDEHPHTLSALTDLALTLRLRGEVDESRRLDRKALEGLRARLGNDHPSTIIAGMSLASDLFALGQPQGARGLDVAIVERAMRVLGLDHPTTLSAKANLAQDLCALGRDEGTALRSDVALLATAKLGADHPLVAAFDDPDARMNCDIDPMPL